MKERIRKERLASSLERHSYPETAVTSTTGLKLYPFCLRLRLAADDSEVV